MPESWIVNFISNGLNDVLCEKKCAKLMTTSAFKQLPCFIQNPKCPTPPSKIFKTRKEALNYLVDCDVDHNKFNVNIIHNKISDSLLDEGPKC